MSYSVNPMQFRSIFAVPTDIVDKHIRIANGDQLKVLLWILRNSPDAPDIAPPPLTPNKRSICFAN